MIPPTVLSHDPDRKQWGQADRQKDRERVTDMYSVRALGRKYDRADRGQVYREQRDRQKVKDATQTE